MSARARAPRARVAPTLFARRICASDRILSSFFLRPSSIAFLPHFSSVPSLPAPRSLRPLSVMGPAKNENETLKEMLIDLVADNIKARSMVRQRKERKGKLETLSLEGSMTTVKNKLVGHGGTTGGELS